MVDQQRTGCFGNRGTDHDVQSNEETSFVDGLTNVVTLSESQTASDRSTSARSNTRVEAINIEAQVDGQVPVGVDVVQSQLNDLADTVLVDLMHRESLDTVFLKDLPLASIDITKTDVDESVGGKITVDPLILGNRLVKAQQEGNRHAMDVTGVGGSRSVDVSVSIDPNHASVRVFAAKIVRLAIFSTDQ